jgi:hypothetical protein
MPKSIRQQIVEAIDTRFKTILTTGGYETNIGQNVHWFRGRLDPAGLPAIVCRDHQTQEWATAGAWTRTLTIEMELYLAPTATPDTIMRSALADIEVAVGSDDTWGGLAETTHLFEGERPQIDDYETIIVASGIFLAIEYTTAPWNPRG